MNDSILHHLFGSNLRNLHLCLPYGLEDYRPRRNRELEASWTRTLSQVTKEELIVEPVLTLKYVVASIVYSLIGIGILTFACLVFDALTPGKLWDEIVKEKNLSVAIVLGAMVLAVGHIIASAIHG